MTKRVIDAIVISPNCNFLVLFANKYQYLINYANYCRASLKNYQRNDNDYTNH